MSRRLQGTVCILTGATGGIGTALAAACASEGARLILCGRRAEVLAERVVRWPAAVLDTVCGDLTDAEVRARLRRRVAQHAKRPLILVNAAGSAAFGPFADLDEARLRQVMEVDLLLPMLMTRDLLDILRASPRGQVVNVGSTFGAIGFPGFAAYCGAKSGLRGWSEALGRELGTDVLVQHVAPRTTRTEFNSAAVERLNEALGNTCDEPEWVAARIIEAIARGQRERFLGWPERFFVRLNGLFPGLVDRALGKKRPVLEAHYPMTDGVSS